ncbi:hypothetical protein CA13_26270 [Planctomycetes bacterium CA13]|uniref:Uncharacterized protein n=1 Tax=Novipirellula herctigrandis TaxID=2527986 RepID=A0A5C5Z1I4_9BACT|nr:hypothetical protein CA13_26270 [Planctomycetes bacterium CA13]
MSSIAIVILSLLTLLALTTLILFVFIRNAPLIDHDSDRCLDRHYKQKRVQCSPNNDNDFVGRKSSGESKRVTPTASDKSTSPTPKLPR